jgi:hypothetical protein
MQQIPLDAVIDEPEVRVTWIDEDEEKARLPGNRDPDAVILQRFEALPFARGSCLVP